MAQNSDALQEPSMDELLASIREIIEENAGLPPQDGSFQGADNAARIAQSETAMQARSRSYDATMPNLKQDIRLRNGGNNGNAAPNGYNNAGNGAYNNGGQDNNFSQNGFNIFAGASNGNAASMRGNNAGHDAQPVQDSMNALAERIGLRRNNPAVKNEAHGKPQQADNHASSLPPFMVPQANNGAGGNGHVPFSAVNNIFPQNGGQPVNSGAMPRARFNPAAAETGFRDSGNGRRERPRAAEGKETLQSAPQMRQKAGAERNAGGRSVEAQPADRRINLADFEKTLPGDVEHSTENLLRPFIAQWLDEHFRGLFEKILREEVQRFIQSMHRG